MGRAWNLHIARAVQRPPWGCIFRDVSRYELLDVREDVRSGGVSWLTDSQFRVIPSFDTTELRQCCLSSGSAELASCREFLCSGWTCWEDLLRSWKLERTPPHGKPHS
eukprot:s1260_g16.t1